MQPSDDERAHLEETSRAFAEACATEGDWTVSLTLLDGCVHFRLYLGNYQRGKQ